MKCVFCNQSVEVLNHPGIGRLVHHGGAGCKNAGAHTEPAWEIMNGKPFEEVVSGLTVEQLSADPSIVQPEVADAPKTSKRGK